MSPRQAAPDDDREFPRLNGRNFIIWKTRVTAALEGKNLLGFVTHPDYTGDSDPDFSDDNELDPALFNQNQAVKKTLDEIGAPNADPPADTSQSATSDASSTASDAGRDVGMTQENLPAVKTFTATKQDERKRAEKLKAKSPKLSSRQLRHMEVKAKAFLIKTIDDNHVLMVKDKTTAYEIYKTLCTMYEDAIIHGDPHYILNYLVALKYEENSDLNKFLYDLEEAMKAASDAINSVMGDEQKTIYLYHSLPEAWKAEMTSWKGNRKYVPYKELKHHIETKARNEMARNHYILKQGTPESCETRSEKALQTADPTPTPEPAKEATALRHLLNGHVKAGTVIPANFKVKVDHGSQRQHPYKHENKGDRNNNHHINYNGRGNNSRNSKGRREDRSRRNDYQGRNNRNKFQGCRNQGGGNSSDNSEYGIIAIMTLNLAEENEKVSLTAQDVNHDPTCTIDSGCTRHVTSRPNWFENLQPTTGKSITVGGNHQIPIVGTGDVKLKIEDNKGNDRIITLNNVLYTPELKFNPLSVHQAVEDDYKLKFPKAKKCVLFFAHRIKFEARTGEGSRLYQFQARPADTCQAAHVAHSGSGEN